MVGVENLLCPFKDLGFLFRKKFEESHFTCIGCNCVRYICVVNFLNFNSSPYLSLTRLILGNG